MIASGTPPAIDHTRREAGAADARVRAAARPNKIRLLVFTSLYPNAVQPSHGRFVEERLRRLLASGGIEATVVAPVPWFPFRHRRFGNYAALARVPSQEDRHGIRVLHPRYPVIPKVGMHAAPFLMYRALLPVLRELLTDGHEFDLIDAHYFYPDGVAAARLGMALAKPVVITARGSDVTWIPRNRRARRRIKWAAEHATAVATVSQALKDDLVAIGVDASRITVLRNGVDLEQFRPLDRVAIRAKLGLVGPVWLSVGHLTENKGQHLAIAALAKTTDASLLLAGTGPGEDRLRRLAEELGVAARVRFLGALPHADLCEYYNAADALFHPSAREGMPNAVLEALASGTPVIAAPFESAVEVVAAPAAGYVAAARTADAILTAWKKLQVCSPNRGTTRQYAMENLGWGATVRAQQSMYADVVLAWRHQQSGVMS